MSLPTFLYLLAIIAVLPAAIRVTGRPSIHVRNPTALALVITWLFGRVIWALTHDPLPVKAMVIEDLSVVIVTFLKDDWVSCDYRNHWHQFACFFWHERTPWDRAILTIFPLAWLFYAPEAAAFIGPAVRLLMPAADNGQIQFWVLWSLSLAQLMLAGLEATHPWLERMAKQLRAVTAERPPPGSEMHTAWRLAGHE